MQIINFLEKYQKSTSRDYIQRVMEHDKAECAEVAKQWGKDYWDGNRQYGYGGYHYDGRWAPIAKEILEYYEIKNGDRILDIGCGKGFLLHEMKILMPDIEVFGIDISKYGIDDSQKTVKDSLTFGNATSLPWPDEHFDFVFSINTFHNLKNFELQSAIREMERVGKTNKKWLCIESFRNEKEKVNLLYWQLTCRTFLDTEEWQWLLEQNHYQGDLGFIFFD